MLSLFRGFVILHIVRGTPEWELLGKAGMSPSKHGAGVSLLRAATICTCAALVSSCGPQNARPIRATPPPPPRVGVEAVARAIPEKVKDRRGWAEVVIAALDAIGKTPAREPVCAVLAVIEQESGFVADPAVPNLARTVEAKLDELGKRAGPIGRPAIDRLLEGKAPGQKDSFAVRLKKVKTERDLDIVFRDLVAFYRAKYPDSSAAHVAEAIQYRSLDRSFH